MQFAGRDVVARKEDVGGYWKKAMDRQPMPEAIRGRIHPQPGKGVHFAEDFDAEPDDSGDNINWHKPKSNPAGDHIHPQSGKGVHFAKDFEPDDSGDNINWHRPKSNPAGDHIHPQSGKGVHFAKDFEPDDSGDNINWHRPKSNPAGDLFHPEARPKEENSPISKAKP